MAQVVPSVLFHGQALKLINELREAYSVGIGTADELIGQLREALTNFESTVGVPFFDFEPVVEGEPPTTAKINRLWDNLSHDINVLSQQADISKATTLFVHNLIATELMKCQQANARVANKLKTLQLYSKSVDTSIITFGDHFRSTEFVDASFNVAGQEPSYMGESYVVLGQEGQVIDLAGQAAIEILETSNGFLGNLHEVTGELRLVEFAKLDTTKPNEQVKEAVFKAELNPRRDLGALTDSSPATWMEYEHIKVSNADRQLAGNMNFTYERQVRQETENDRGTELVDWATGPSGGVLKLDVQFDLGAPQNVNYITYVPYNLEDNANYPVTVVQVQTSVDRTNWEPVRPRNVQIGPTANLQSASATSEGVIGNGFWAFTGRVMRYVQFSIEQSHPIKRDIGHLYYLVERRKEEGTKVTYVEERTEGPSPLLADPTAFYDPSIRRVGTGSSSAVQRREVFKADRWVIGIRDVAIQQVQHRLQATMVTKPLRVGGVVDRVLLDADVTIPPEFPPLEQWVSFFISPDNGKTWAPIARVQDDFLGIPEVVAFNDPLPESVREPGVGYYTTAEPVTAVRLKVVLKRPNNLPSATPVLHRYTLKVKKRV